MVAIIMASTSSLVNRLRSDFPDLSFEASDNFRWSPSQKIIFHPRKMQPADVKDLLHELAHAVLGHDDYEKDIELLHKEREAWEYASIKLAPRYKITISEDDIEDALDSYRDWLHRRSICPECSASAPQQPKNTYKCIVCGCSWRANDARVCELRRYKLKTA